MTHAETPNRISRPWGDRTPYPSGGSWPQRVDEQYADGVRAADVQRWARSASILHSNGDAMDIAVVDDRIVGVRGTRRRSRQPRSPRHQGPLRLAGQQLAATG